MDAETSNNGATNCGLNTRSTTELRSVVIRFAGDSGDGIQTTGAHFSNESAMAGNDVSTCPNFPSEIRPPAGSVEGVSGFQINFASYEVSTPGDSPDVLVALNPAALRANIEVVKPGGIIVINEDAFTRTNLKKAGYVDNPCDDPNFASSYRIYNIPVTTLTKKALAETRLSPKEVSRCKNFFVLGVTLTMFNRPSEETIEWIEEKFGKKPELAKANIEAFRAGLAYADATEVIDVSYVVKPAKLKPGRYRNLSGTTAVCFGLVAASKVSGLPLFYGAYPITPASDILHELSRLKHLGVQVFQAEDEIAAVGASIGASFAGQLAATGTSGPGMALKSEALGLAVIAELPLVVVNVQRAGPSTGMPTKSEQSDLFQAMYGRHGEAPLCVLAASNPRSAFEMTYEACRLAVTYMTPVVLLSEGFTTYTMAPWRIPDVKELQKFGPRFPEPRHGDDSDVGFKPYERDPQTLARPWAVPGMKNYIHRTGGLEKLDGSGAVSYDPDNHQKMSELRAEKIKRIQSEIKPLKVRGESTGELLLVGWGGTEGAIREAVMELQDEGQSVSSVHVYHLNPLPPDLGSILKGFKKVIVPESNGGQFTAVLRQEYLVDAEALTIMRGEPLRVQDIAKRAREILDRKSSLPLAEEARGSVIA